MMDKIVEGGWYKECSMFIHVTKILKKDWSEIHVMILRDPIMINDRKFLHEWTKMQYTPDGYWPGIMVTVQMLPEGPPQEILDALEWPSDGDGYRSLPKETGWI